MPSSPYRQKSRRYDRHQSHSKSSDRNFGADSRKKVHKDREYDYPTSKRQYHQKYDDTRQRDTNRDRQSRYQKKPTSGNISKESNKYDSGSKIQTIEVKFTHPPSDLKVHFRFKPIKINQKNQDQLLKSVKDHFSENIGPVEYFSRSYDSKPGNLIIQLGFKYDFDALLYFSGKKDKFEVKLNGQQLDMIAEPTQAFKMLIPELEMKKKGGNIHIKQKSPQHQQRKLRSASKQKHIKRRKSSSSSRSASSSSSSRSHSSKSKRRHSNDKQQRGGKRDYYEKESRYNKGDNYDRNNKDRSRERTRNYDDRKAYQHGKDNGYPNSPQHHGYNNKYDKYDNSNAHNSNNNDRYHKSSEYQSKKYENNQKQQQQIDNDPNLKTLFFFGIHYSVNSKDMTQLLYNHKQGPFYSKKFIWRRMNNSISEFLQGRFEISQANKLLQISSKMQVKGHPFIIIQGTPQASNQFILQKLSQFQVQIQFPRLVQPYYLLKSLMQCGRLIQIVSINKLNQQGRSDFYNVTFNSSQICGFLKQVKKTSSGILIQEVNQQNVMLVYRPNSQTELMESKYIDENKDRNNNKDLNQDNDNKSEASRSYSRKSQF